MEKGNKHIASATPNVPELHFSVMRGSTTLQEANKLVWTTPVFLVWINSYPEQKRSFVVWKLVAEIMLIALTKKLRFMIDKFTYEVFFDTKDQRRSLYHFKESNDGTVVEYKSSNSTDHKYRYYSITMKMFKNLLKKFNTVSALEVMDIVKLKESGSLGINIQQDIPICFGIPCNLPNNFKFPITVLCKSKRPMRFKSSSSEDIKQAIGTRIHNQMVRRGVIITSITYLSDEPARYCAVIDREMFVVGIKVAFDNHYTFSVCDRFENYVKRRQGPLRMKQIAENRRVPFTKKTFYRITCCELFEALKYDYTLLTTAWNVFTKAEIILPDCMFMPAKNLVGIATKQFKEKRFYKPKMIVANFIRFMYIVFGSDYCYNGITKSYHDQNFINDKFYQFTRPEVSHNSDTLSILISDYVSKAPTIIESKEKFNTLIRKVVSYLGPRYESFINTTLHPSTRERYDPGPVIVQDRGEKRLKISQKPRIDVRKGKFDHLCSFSSYLYAKSLKIRTTPQTTQKKEVHPEERKTL